MTIKAGYIIGVVKPVEHREFKYLVNLGNDENNQVIKGFLINSENRQHYYCFKLLQERHNFLKYDSYIACSNLMEFSVQQIYQINQRIQVYSVLNTDEKRGLIEHIKQARTLTPIQKKFIIDMLQS